MQAGTLAVSGKSAVEPLAHTMVDGPGNVVVVRHIPDLAARFLEGHAGFDAVGRAGPRACEWQIAQTVSGMDAVLGVFQAVVMVQYQPARAEAWI